MAGRLVDRLGARRVLLPLAVIHAVALGAIVGLTELDAPTAVLLVCGFAAGFAVPPTSSVLRSQWTNLLEPRLHQAAYALDSTMIELIFISGPLLTAAIAYVASPAAALIVSAVAVLAGTTIFTALPPTREIAFERGEAKGLLGALASPGVRTLVYTSLPAGVGIGILEVGIPAFSREEGAAAAAGVLLAIWSVGSAIGGLPYGLLPRRAGLQRTHLFVGALLPITLLPLAAAPSVPVMALLVIPAGLLHRAAAGDAQRAGRRRGAAGHADRGLHLADHGVRGRDRGGAALAGALVEGPGWRTAFVVAAVSPRSARCWRWCAAAPWSPRPRKRRASMATEGRTCSVTGRSESVRPTRVTFMGP